ncbi:MAG: metallophosphatase [Bacteroides sp.]|nr:metallophosphatase [Bacteroides sp.]
MRYILSLLLCFLALESMAQETVQRLLILQTSDTHSRLESVPATSADARCAGLGGVERRSAFVNRMRNETPDLLLLDCGDFSQGSLYYNIFRGEVEIQAMNLMGYDAVTIGNHEFDYGLDNMARLFRMARFPIVCANYDFTGTVLEGLVKRYTVVQRHGLKIGIFGLGTRLEGLVQAHNYVGVGYREPVAVAREVVDILRDREGCDVVICLSHLGIVQGADDSSGYDNELAMNTRGIDLILGGHTHTFMETPEVYLNADGREVKVFHTGKQGAYVGRVELMVRTIKE